MDFYSILFFITLSPAIAIVVWAMVDLGTFAFKKEAVEEAQDVLEPIPADENIPTKFAWQRYLARVIDLTVVSIAFGAVIAFDTNRVFEDIVTNNVGIAILSVNICMFYEMSCLAAFNTTAGKALMGVKLTFPETNIGKAAIKRSLFVWYRGMAGGFPLITLFANYAGFKNYKKYGASSWDAAAGTTLACNEIHLMRWVLGIGIVMLSYAGAIISIAATGSPQ